MEESLALQHKHSCVDITLKGYLDIKCDKKIKKNASLQIVIFRLHIKFKAKISKLLASYSWLKKEPDYKNRRNKQTQNSFFCL